MLHASGFVDAYTMGRLHGVGNKDGGAVLKHANLYATVKNANAFARRRHAV